MKKRLEKKLSLSKETLRNLSERELTGVVGGFSRFCSTISECSDESCITCEGSVCTTTSENC